MNHLATLWLVSSIGGLLSGSVMQSEHLLNVPIAYDSQPTATKYSLSAFFSLPLSPMRMGGDTLRWAEGISAALSRSTVSAVKVIPVAESTESAEPAEPAATHAASPAPVALSAMSMATEPTVEPSSLAGSTPPASSASSECLSLKALAPAIAPLFQIRVHGQEVAELPNQHKADAIAQTLQQTINTPGFDPNQIKPALVNGQPVGKAGDTVLFAIDPTLAKQLNHSPELTAIAWVNNLRTALDAPLLSIVDAQAQMHDLTPTTKQLKGNASWYGPEMHGNPTATGEPFDPTDLTAAHPSLPFDTYLKVTNLETGNAIIVRINDRGPYEGDRSLDLSPEAAHCLESKQSGVVPYEAVVMSSGDAKPSQGESPPTDAEDHAKSAEPPHSQTSLGTSSSD